MLVMMVKYFTPTHIESKYLTDRYGHVSHWAQGWKYAKKKDFPRSYLHSLFESAKKFWKNQKKLSLAPREAILFVGENPF